VVWCLGDNPAGNEVDETQQQPTDTIGPIPDEHTDGHEHHEDDPDTPVRKFAERFPADDEDEAADQQSSSAEQLDASAE
jgi:hypothetical protein